jgi:acetyltransferase-like isoleucine patch superfamily enzyme
VIGENVTIGDYSYVNENSIIISGRIGHFCSIGYCCHIGLQEHPIQYLSTSPFAYASNQLFSTHSGWLEVHTPPDIGSDVWIGSSAIILQGVSVGHGSIVAAGAVVTKDVLPYKIVAGVPAREIGNRFEQRIAELLLQWKWWDLPLEELYTYKELLTSTPSVAALTRVLAFPQKTSDSRAHELRRDRADAEPVERRG